MKNTYKEWKDENGYHYEIPLSPKAYKKFLDSEIWKVDFEKNKYFCYVCGKHVDNQVETWGYDIKEKKVCCVPCGKQIKSNYDDGRANRNKRRS
jgi:hypothetical protein